MIQYDESVIQAHAARLYEQARRLALTAAVVGGGLGLLAGLAVWFLTNRTDDGSPGIFVVVGLIIGAAVGYSRGEAQGFRLRLEAQTALCQAQIERNTRARVTGDLRVAA